MRSRMTDRKKPGVAFWTTVALVVLMLYVLSVGPACWMLTWAGDPDWAVSPYCAVYAPIFWVHSELPVIADANSPPSYRRGFFFWSLAPFLILFLAAMPVLIERRGPGSIIALCGVEAAVLLLLVGLWNPYRFWWTWRALGAVVFLSYLSYAIVMVIEGRLGPGRRSESTLINALLGMFAFGLPGLWYAVFGRLTWLWLDRLPPARSLPDLQCVEVPPIMILGVCWKYETDSIREDA